MRAKGSSGKQVLHRQVGDVETDDEERSRGDAEFPVSFNITQRRKTVEQEETERTEEAELDSSVLSVCSC